MEAYRDQYATLFKNGRNAAAIGVRGDADTAGAAGAREKDFPVVFASDSGGRVGRLYEAYDAKNAMDNRSLFVIGADGRIAYGGKPFNVLSAKAYSDLGAVVDSLTKLAPGGGIP